MNGYSLKELKLLYSIRVCKLIYAYTFCTQAISCALYLGTLHRCRSRIPLRTIEPGVRSITCISHFFEYINAKIRLGTDEQGLCNGIKVCVVVKGGKWRERI